MSLPKQFAKRQSLERKRRRKSEVRRKRQANRRCYGEPTDCLAAPPCGVGMSDVLAEFVAPFFADDFDIEAYRRLLTLGMVAWNAALAPPAARDELIDRVLTKGLTKEPEDVRARCREIVDHLLARKQRYFSQLRRPILDYRLVDTGEGYHLSVVSALT